jgi:hypothetical protein
LAVNRVDIYTSSNNVDVALAIFRALPRTSSCLSIAAGTAHIALLLEDARIAVPDHRLVLTELEDVE